MHHRGSLTKHLFFGMDGPYQDACGNVKAAVFNTRLNVTQHPGPARFTGPIGSVPNTRTCFADRQSQAKVLRKMDRILVWPQGADDFPARGHSDQDLDRRFVVRVVLPTHVQAPVAISL